MPDMNENAETQQEYFGKAKLETDYKDLSMRLYKRIADLEKENAELKAFRQDCVKLTEDNVVIVRQRAEASKQLTKAKEIIKGLKAHLDLSDCVNNDYRLQLLKQAEQFLKDQEEEPCGQ